MKSNPVFVMPILVYALAGEVYADEFSYGHPLSIEKELGRCKQGQGVTIGLCLQGLASRLKQVLKTRIDQRLDEIAKVATQAPGPGMLAGPAAAAGWKRDFMVAQKAWEAYDARQCQNLVDYEFYGGTVAGLFKEACEIRHLVIRINELTLS